MESGHNLLQYFFPGNLILAVLFAAIFSNISLIEDRHQGFLQSVLVAPISSGAIVAGKSLGGALIAFSQGVIFLALAPVAGIPLTALMLAKALLTILVISFTLTVLGFAFAWRFDSVQGFHAVMNLILMPMWLLSGAFFPVERAPYFLKPLMFFNPLAFGFGALRSSIFGTSEAWPGFPVGIAACLAFGFVFYLIAGQLVSKGEEGTV
jgi:ABC-2 type transport system permease protein